MIDTRFGSPSTGLLRRLRRTRIAVADLREVAEEVLPALAEPGLRLDVVRRSGEGSVVVLEEDERSVRVPLVDLADEMTHAGVSSTPAEMSAALASWVAHRPVTDAAAAAAGIAVLDWADATRTSVGWQVVVPRREFALPWTPSDAAAAATVHRVRAAATGRAHEVPVQLRVEGPVALWSHASAPVLATAALVAPRRMWERTVAAGLTMSDMRVVITPHRPVACAAPGVAARLAGETGEACVTLPWARLTDLRWL